MISKRSEKEEAIALRKAGYSYNQIRKRVSVSKSTLSLWLRSIGLAKRRLQEFTEQRRINQLKAVRIWHEKCVSKKEEIIRTAAREIDTISDRELWLIGIALYWGEGNKERTRSTLVKFSNMDPHMIILFKKWLTTILHIPLNMLQYTLSIHERSPNIHEALAYWAEFLDVPVNEISVSYKKHNSSPKRKNIGVYYRGLIRVTVYRSTDLNRKIQGWINGIASHI